MRGEGLFCALQRGLRRACINMEAQRQLYRRRSGRHRCRVLIDSIARADASLAAAATTGYERASPQCCAKQAPAYPHTQRLQSFNDAISRPADTRSRASIGGAHRSKALLHESAGMVGRPQIEHAHRFVFLVIFLPTKRVEPSFAVDLRLSPGQILLRPSALF